jgi:predicted MFS family arabinose efflux permease
MAEHCDCGYEFATGKVDPEISARTRSVRRRHVTIIVLAIVIPFLIYLLLTSVGNYKAISSLLIAAGVFSIGLLNIIRLSRLDRKTRKSVEEAMSRLSKERGHTRF